MKPDPRIEMSAQQSGQNDIKGGDQDNTQHPGSKQRRNRRTPFGGLPRFCPGVQNMLPAYLDASLNAEERQTVARHLDLCAACRYQVGLLALSEQALIGAASAVPMPGDLRAGFYARLAVTPRRADKRRAFVPALTVCGLLLIASTTAYRLHFKSDNSTEQNEPGLSDARSVAKNHSAELPHLLPRRQIARTVGLPESPVRNRPLRSLSALAYQSKKQRSVPAAQKTTPVGRAAHQALASAFTSHRAELTPGRPGQHREQQSFAAVSRSAFSQRLLTIAASKRKKNSSLPGQHNIQVALLTQGERNAAASPQVRRDVSLMRAEPAPSTDNVGLQTDAMDANAVSLAKDQRSGMAMQYENGKQVRLSTMQPEAIERDSVAGARYGRAMGYDAPEMDGVSFQVKDAQRGFVSGTRSESRMQMRGGRQVLSVHLEDQDRPELDTADKPALARPAVQPAQTTKTGSEKER